MRENWRLGGPDRTGGFVLDAASIAKGGRNEYLGRDGPFWASSTGCNPDLIGANPMLTQTKRHRGGQPGNTNALKHGEWSARVRAERRAAREKAWTEQERRSLAW